MLDKTYRPQEVETRLYQEWEKGSFFKAGLNKGGDPFTIVIPPPNVTGSLHMGHALNNTLQDILIRWHRMKGRDALWQPGTDHAGIATQMVVERQLAEQGIDRRDMGREAFIEKVWDWKEESGGTITNQLRRLGASCDWSRERFTMDEGLSAAVRRVFVRLHKDGLIYRDKRLVNWDPKFLTAISDLEVENRDVQGNMWHFRYPLEDDPNRFITVATTRPETMLGDTCVAVHPDDERYTGLIGKHVILPLVGRRIPIVADEYADPEQGSGAVKITPAHDFNDFEVGRRVGAEAINILDQHAHLNENVPEAYRGMERFAAREKVIADLDALGLLEKVEEITHTVPYGDRSGVVIEPWLTDQWYVDAATLARPAIEAVETGKIQFVPKNWENTYFEWMRNIQPWCVSRQLWWGHQIPAWYGPDGTIFVEEIEAEAQAAADSHYGEPTELTRETDVLDTWFSSALWPFSTLGWPEETPELARYYPTDVLITGFDIIFFWVARMVMMGMHFMKEVPFHTVYIHALVRDEQGQKMSKSKGNVIDPLELVDEFGADALRFTLCAMAAQGRDIKLSKQRVAGYRNFATKIWNAARFCEMNECVAPADFDPATLRQPVNRWIASEAAKAVAAIDRELGAYRFNEAANAVYRYTWNIFCDWYLEFAKPAFMSNDPETAKETRETAGWALQQILAMLHPFAPYVTEELAQRTGADKSLMVTDWPALDYSDEAAERAFAFVIDVISEIRSARAETNVPAKAEMVAHFPDATAEQKDWLDGNWGMISRMARLKGCEFSMPDGGEAAELVVDGMRVVLPLAGVIDMDAEKARLTKELKKLDGEIERIDKKLSNEKFTARAPEEVVAQERERRVGYVEAQTKLKAAMERLAG
ncbi:valine--tRNA ligase [Minwuia sp.]|uniref:valine--tRNA ligase n=1 Tax=Minwuia sp. TaxID=2493630 RepID=UPI003A9070AB